MSILIYNKMIDAFIIPDLVNDKVKKPNHNKDQTCGIWYTGIVLFGKEYAFSQAGIECTIPVSIG